MSKAIGKILGILLSVSIIVSGICMIMQCLSIYNSGDKPYSREAVAQAFSEISVPIFICIALMILTFVYNIFVDGIYPKTFAAKNNSFIIKAITQKIDIANSDTGELKKERTKRIILNVILIILLLAGFGCFFIYALNPSNYHQSDINTSMIKAMAVFGACIALPFIYSVICVFVNDKSREREIKILREFLKNPPTKNDMHKKSNAGVYIYIKIAALIISACILVYGLISGGTADVLTKAINICTECIGLG